MPNATNRATPATANPITPQNDATAPPTGTERQPYVTRQRLRHMETLVRQNETKQIIKGTREEKSFKKMISRAYEKNVKNHPNLLQFKVQQDAKALSEALHLRRLKRMRQVFHEDKKLDWMFDAPDV